MFKFGLMNVMSYVLIASLKYRLDYVNFDVEAGVGLKLSFKLLC